MKIRELSELHELEAIYQLFDAIWHPDPHNPPVTTEMLRALSKAGSYIAGAYDGSELVGACVGFFGAPSELTLHSHVAGVSPQARGRDVGFALKLHQREWALERGLTGIEWTFDPLIRRNAYFNLVKLGARPKQYLTNFYGQMRDEINGEDESDRLLVRWHIDEPVGGVEPTDSADGVRVAVPTDVESLRTTDFAAAREWRLTVRKELGGLMAAGARVTGFNRDGWYVVEREGVA